MSASRVSLRSVFLLALVFQARAFTPGPASTSTATGRSPRRLPAAASMASAAPSPSAATTALQMAEGPFQSTDGNAEGQIILAVVLLLNVWIFSIPPEFRRAKICPEEISVQSGGKCVTPESWRDGIADYYRNGGGISFDFSIEGKE
ncbi:hypothetical protein ACHAWF_016853 [Thalassiosira exigua]